MFLKKTKKLDCDLIIHIGEGKTGSSAIQKYLNDKSKNLLSRGIFYPKHFVDSNNISSGHGIIYDPLIAGDFELAGNNLQNLLHESKDKGCTLLLSSENFQNFHSFFENFSKKNSINLKVVCFIRDMVGRLNSSYNQAIKRHSCPYSLSIAIDKGEMAECLESRENIPLNWLKSFNKDIIFIPYIPKNFKEGIENFFLQVIGVKGFKKEKKPKINRSYSASALLFQRELNKFITEQFGTPITVEIDIALQKFSETYIDDVKFDAFSELTLDEINDLETKIEQIELGFLKKISKNLISPAAFTQKIEQKKPFMITRKYSFEFIVNNFLYREHPGLLIELKDRIIKSNQELINANIYTLEIAKAFGCNLSTLRMNPINNFDVEHHNDMYPGIMSDGVNSYEHFIKFGLKEGKYNFDL